MDPMATVSYADKPKTNSPLGTLDYVVYLAERGIAWIALLAMAITYFLDILERELTAGPGQNAVQRFILERMGETPETVDPAFLESLHTLWGPFIMAATVLLLLLTAGFTARVHVEGQEGFTRLEGSQRVQYWVWSLLGLLGFGAGLIYIPSTWFCALILLSGLAWGLSKAKAKGEFKKAAAIWIPAVGLLLWFTFARIESEYDWSKDLAKMLLMWVGFIGASMATYENRNIQVDFVRKNVPKKWLKPYEAVGSIITAVFTVVLALLAYDTVSAGMKQAVLMPNIRLAEYLIPFPIMAAFGLVAVRYLVRAQRIFSGAESVALNDAPESTRPIKIIASIFAVLMLLAIVGMSTEGAGLVITLLALLLVGAPLYVVIGGLALACFAFWPQLDDYLGSFEAFNQNFNLMARMRDLADQEALIAIPFFMVAGAIMSRGAIAKQLVECARAIFGWLPGGLAISAVVACMFFAAISGSSPVTVITIGAIMLPALKQAGYDEEFSLGLVTSAGSLGIIIPPSIPMIIYAIFATLNGTPVDIKDLFIAGIGPGIVIGLALGVLCVYRGANIAREPFCIRRVFRSLRDGFWALFLPAVILIGIYFGIFNAIEASAIAVILALYIELFIHRELDVSELPGVLADSSALMGSILVIISVALGLSEFFTVREIPDALVAWLASYELTPLGFVLMLNVLLIIVGCLMDIISALILFVPLLIPLANQLGIDPIHLGLIFIVNLEIGYLTPPLGLNLFVSSGFFQVPFGRVMKSVIPFIGALLLSLIVITAVPTISLGPVNFMYDKPIYVPFPSGKTLKPAASKAEDAGPSSFIAATTESAEDAEETGDTAQPKRVDLATMTDMSRATMAEGTGAVEDFDPTFARAYAQKSDGKHSQTVVLMTNDNLNCGDPGAGEFEDEWLLRLVIPAGAKANDGFKVGENGVIAELVTYKDGNKGEPKPATSGVIVIVEAEKGEKISIMDPENEGMTLGLFGAFELKFGEDTLNGKFVPAPCEEGQPVYR